MVDTDTIVKAEPEPLPSELFQEILLHFTPENALEARTLSSCCLVNHQFLYFSRRVLYAKVQLTPAKTVGYRGRASSHYASFHPLEFYQFLTRPGIDSDVQSGIAACVHWLVFDFDINRRGKRGTLMDMGLIDHWDNIPLAVEKLVNLKCVELRKIFWNQVSQPVRSLFCDITKLPRVRKVVLDTIGADSSMRDFLVEVFHPSTVPSTSGQAKNLDIVIQSIVSTTVYGGGSKKGSNSPIDYSKISLSPSYPVVRSLEISLPLPDVDPDESLRLITSPETPFNLSSLQTLSLLCVTSVDASMLLDILYATKSSLVHLTLGWTAGCGMFVR
jgi:hypothetical protein